MTDRPRPGITTNALVIDNIQDNSGKLDTGIKQKQLLKEVTTIGTWNVRRTLCVHCTLQQCGKLIELEHDLRKYRWYIIGLSGVGWLGKGEVTTEDGNIIWYSGNETKHEHGVAFIVKK